VIITGAASGIGAAAAEELRRRGAQVVGLDLNATGDIVECDVRDQESVERAVRDAIERLGGRLDVLINNAGVGIGSPIAEAETKKLDMQLDVNLRGVYLTLRECIPMLKEAGAEHRKALVVNTASIAGVRGQGWLAAYSATKAGVIGLTEAAHIELSGDGIQVTAFAPGFVDTPMTDWAEDQVSRDQMIRPEDIAEAVRFLLRTSPACIVPEMRFIRPGDN
jgi:NAD(P)-dependent dehydrogenase (short-subunit alcohol dehydrogenase family)